MELRMYILGKLTFTENEMPYEIFYCENLEPYNIQILKIDLMLNRRN